MHGGLTAAHIVVVHAGQVVMYETVRMQRLDCGGGPDRLRWRDAMESGAFEHQKSTQPFAAICRVCHRLYDGQIVELP